jgi:hypothetical protein
VENYIPIEATRLALKKPELEAPGKYDDFITHIGRSTDKTVFARRIIPEITLAQLQTTLDLPEKLDHVCKQIRDWNRLPET